MNRFSSIMATVLAAAVLMVLCSGIPANTQAIQYEETVPYTQVQTLSSGGVTEEDGDIDVPFLPNPTLRRISIEKLPTKVAYLKGEALDLTGMVVKAVYSDNSSKNVTSGFTVTGYDPNTPGKQTVTLSYGGKVATFGVVVCTCGDSNADGTVDGMDATLLLQYAAGWDVQINMAVSDANGDGTVDGMDATLLLQYAAGWDVTLG